MFPLPPKPTPAESLSDGPATPSPGPSILPLAPVRGSPLPLKQHALRLQSSMLRIGFLGPLLVPASLGWIP